MPVLNPYTASRLNLVKNFRQISKVNINSNVFDNPDKDGTTGDARSQLRKQSTASASDALPEIRLDGSRHAQSTQKYRQQQERRNFDQVKKKLQSQLQREFDEAAFREQKTHTTFTNYNSRLTDGQYQAGPAQQVRSGTGLGLASMRGRGNTTKLVKAATSSHVLKQYAKIKITDTNAMGSTMNNSIGGPSAMLEARKPQYRKGQMMDTFDLKNPNKLLSRHSNNLKNYYEQKEQILHNLSGDSGSPTA